MATRLSRGEQVRRSIEFQFGVDPGPIKDGVKVAENSIEGLEIKLKELRDKFEKEPIGTKRFEELGREIQKVEGELKTIDTRFEALTGEQKAAALVDSFNGVTGAIGAVTGALVALGVKSDVLDEVEKRLLGIVNVVVGLQAVSKSFESIAKIAPGLAASITKVGQAIKSAFVANPILAVVTAIAAVTAGLILANDEAEKLRKELELQDRARQARLKTLSSQQSLLVAQIEQEATALEQAGKLEEAQQKRIEGAEKLLVLAQKEKKENEQNLNDLIKSKKEEIKTIDDELKDLRRPITEQLAGISDPYGVLDLEQVKRNIEFRTEQLVKLRKPVSDELNALQAESQALEVGIIEATTNLATQRYLLLQVQNDLNKEAGDNAKITNEQLKRLREERLERESIIQLIRQEGEELEQLLLKGALSDRGQYSPNILDVRYLGDLETSLERVVQLSKELVIELEDVDEIKFLSQEQLDILKRLRGELGVYGKDDLAKRLFALETAYKSDLALFADNEEAKLQLTEEYERNKLKVRQQYLAETASAILASTSQLFNVLADINQQNLELQILQANGNVQAIERINKEAFEQAKRLRIGQAVITTAESILNGYNATSTLPPPFNLIAGSALALAYGALGAKTIQNIQATQYGSTTSTSTSGNRPRFGGINLTGGGTANVPSGIPAGTLPGIGGGRTTTAPTTIGEAPMPLQAYVLAGDIQTGLGAITALGNRRRLGG